MAGSYRHIVNKNGDLISNEKFIDSIENLGDAYEMAEECWYLIQILSGGDKKKIDSAIDTMYQMFNHRYRK